MGLVTMPCPQPAPAAPALFPRMMATRPHKQARAPVSQITTAPAFSESQECSLQSFARLDTGPVGTVSKSRAPASSKTAYSLPSPNVAR